MRYDQHHPTRGWQLLKGSIHENEFYGKAVTVNSKGIRGKREYAYERVPGKMRVLIFGDSFTFGTEVGDEETYPYYLQQFLPNAEIINMGVFGYGHDQMLLYLKEEGIKYKPDIVILGYLECDNSRNMLNFRDYAKPRFALKNGNLALESVPISPPEKMLKSEFWRSKLIDLIAIANRQLLIKTGKYADKERAVTDTILHEFVNEVKAMGAIPIIAQLEGIRDNQKDRDIKLPGIKKFIHYWAREKKIPTAFLMPYVRDAMKERFKNVIDTGEPVFFKRKYGHFSPWENAVIAVGLKDYLIKTGILKINQN